MISTRYFDFSLADFLPIRILRVSPSFLFLPSLTHPHQNVNRLKAIRRALRPTSRVTTVVSLALIAAAVARHHQSRTLAPGVPAAQIISRIENPVTLPAPGSISGVRPGSISGVRPGSISGVRPEIAAALKPLNAAPAKPLPTKVRPAHKTVRLEKSPVESPDLYEAAQPPEAPQNTAPIVAEREDSDDRATEGEKAGDAGAEELATLEKLMQEEVEVSDAVNNIEIAQVAADNLLEEDFEANSALDLPSTEVVDAVPTQKEGELQATDFSSYTKSIPAMRLALNQASAEFADAMAAEPKTTVPAVAETEITPAAAEPTSSIVAALVPAPSNDKPVEVVAKTSAEPELVAPTVKVAALAPVKISEPEEKEVAEEASKEENEVVAPAIAANENEADEDSGPQLVRPAAKTVPVAMTIAAPVVRNARVATNLIQSGLGIHPSMTIQPKAEAPVPSGPKKSIDAGADIAALTDTEAPMHLVASRSLDAGPSVTDAPDEGGPQLTSRQLPRRSPEKKESILFSQRKAPKAKVDAEDTDEVDEHAEGGKGSGRVEFDAALAHWLDKHKGHVELYLHPVKGKNPSDTIFLDYDFPDEEFEFSTEGLRGSYRLVAAIFVPEAAAAIAQIALPKPLSAANYKNRIRFSLSFQDFEKARRWQAARMKGLSMTLTVFEGATGDYRSPKPIRQARVAVEGFPELGTFRADSEGNVRIPQVPALSTLKIHAMADGYYDTHVIVPTATTQVYAPIFLISKEKVDTITKFFTKSPQDMNKGVVMGRVYSPKTRTPIADEVVELQFRKGKALYFDALPDPRLNATGKTGLFGFFNVTSTFRNLTRESSELPFLFNVPPQSALYVELGRGGEKALKGKLVAPFSSDMPQAHVRLVGADASGFVTADAHGRFSIPGIDFPSGSLLLEVQADGYPILWYDLPWTPRDIEKTRSLFMIENELVATSAERLARLKWKTQLGAVVGGASGAFFKNREECIAVTLDDLSGKSVGSEFGPFPLSGKATVTRSQKLCLTKANPGFTFFNLQPGEYVVKWRNSKGASIRSRVVRVGLGRVTIAVE